MDTFSLRAQVATGGLKGWTAAFLDVRTAFLTAPLQPERRQSSKPAKQKVIVVRAPRVMVAAGIFRPNTWLLVQGALYGLRESPHSWGVSRDSKLCKLRWKGSGGRLLELRQSESDVSLWRVCDSADGTLKGTVKAIRDTWRSSEPSFATTPRGFTFCCVQIEKVGQDLWIHQRKYIGDLKQRYPNIRPTTPLPEFRNEPPAEEPSPSRIQYAQKVIGELTWVACRTRLDLAYVVNRLSRYAVSNPDYA